MRFVRLLPFIVLVILAALIGFVSVSGQKGDNSPLKSKPVPYFYLADVLHPGQTLNPIALKKPALLTFWASWCGICKIDLPVLGTFAKKHNVALYGIAYHDNQYALKAALQSLEKDVTFTGLGMDDNGAIASEFGLIGVPTLFVIDKAGTIRDVYIGEVSQKTLENKVLPILQ